MKLVSGVQHSDVASLHYAVLTASVAPISHIQHRYITYYCMFYAVPFISSTYSVCTWKPRLPLPFISFYPSLTFPLKLETKGVRR